LVGNDCFDCFDGVVNDCFDEVVNGCFDGVVNNCFDEVNDCFDEVNGCFGEEMGFYLNAFYYVEMIFPNSIDYYDDFFDEAKNFDFYFANERNISSLTSSNF